MAAPGDPPADPPPEGGDGEGEEAGEFPSSAPSGTFLRNFGHDRNSGRQAVRKSTPLPPRFIQIVKKKQPRELARFLKADHPLLARLQKVLFEQISGQHERAQLQLRESEEEARKLVKHREDVGVTLYGPLQTTLKCTSLLRKCVCSFSKELLWNK